MQAGRKNDVFNEIRPLTVGIVQKVIRCCSLTEWAGVLKDPERSGAPRKKAVVAIAPPMVADLWRLFTGKTETEKLEIT